MKAGIAIAALAAFTLCACDGLVEKVREYDSPRTPSTKPQSADATAHESSSAAQPVAPPDAPIAPPVAPPVAASNAASPTPVPAPESHLVPFSAGAVDKESEPVALECEFQGLSLPPKFAVYAAGAYAGRKLDYQIDRSGHPATQIDVSVSNDDTPVVLMLGAYEPTVWNIGWSPRTRIVAVLVSGYHRQAIAGLPASVPRINSSYDNKGPCGYFYVAEKELTKLNPLARQLFGRPVTRAYIAKDGVVAVGNGGRSGLVTDAAQPPSPFRDPDAPLAGEAGLREAVAKGLMREAYESDMRAWQSAYDAARLRDTPPVSGASPSRASGGSPYNTYVVVRPMRVPAGLHGAHSATFIVPRGVQRPTGDLGHSRILDWNTMSCVGAICRMEE